MSAFVGLDVHSDHTFATVINEDGKIVCKKRIMNDQVLSFLKLKYQPSDIRCTT
jgi:hypothetical protein